MSIRSGIDVSGVRRGESLEVVGFGGQYDDPHEVLPRAQADLRLLPAPSRQPPLPSTLQPR